ncbi:MAG TPA: hypothetical protein DCL61_31110 [Cyanobacteria bacterium UBA12227]|nr:hypothetical protein [Cyanobacteria bacterium UBA12227]HAX87317.1 hypothetical protein [Cyanobacteria bacterium UBA11370]HBY76500.1 hypothetical protein [Cyanobacteria bacterium UBA11148]
MKDTITPHSERATIENKLLQPHLIIQALAFTAILYFSVGEPLANTNRGIRYQSVEMNTHLSTTISKTVSNAVLKYAAQHSHLPTSALHLIEAQPHTWSDNCLGLGESGVNCTQMQVPGWQVAIASGQQRWIYRTDASGSVIKLEGSNSSAN